MFLLVAITTSFDRLERRVAFRFVYQITGPNRDAYFLQCARRGLIMAPGPAQLLDVIGPREVFAQASRVSSLHT